MFKIIKSLATVSLSIACMAAFAKPPAELISHNRVDYPTRAYLGPNLDIPQSPTAAGQDKHVSWISVGMMCGATPNNCQAKIAVMSNPEIILGVAKLDLQTGEITPKVLSNGPYKMTVVGNAEIEITKN